LDFLAFFSTHNHIKKGCPFFEQPFACVDLLIWLFVVLTTIKL